MSKVIQLGKSPESPEERQRLIAEHVMMEDYLDRLQANYIQKKVIEVLLGERGYSPEEIEVNREFEIRLPECAFAVSADVMVRVEGRSFLAFKCAMSSLESWERHSVAFCRVAEPSMIPYAAVTDGESVLLIDTGSCGTVSGGLEVIPSREEAVRTLRGRAAEPYPVDRADREKRILHAFDAIRCPAGPPSNE